MTPFLVLLRRELKLTWRDGGAVGTALGFYLIIVALMPLGLGPDLKLLSRIAPGILWVGLLLAALLSLPRMVEGDADDGALEVLATGPLPLEAMMTAKALAHWISTGIPLSILAPLLGLMLKLELGAYPLLIATMLVGTPAISFLGAIGAAVMLGARKGGLLLALLVLPLYIPTLIFGISAIAAAMGPSGLGASFLLLAATSLLAIVIGPLGSAAAIRAVLG
jgi:heme exporter protein B